MAYYGMCASFFLDLMTGEHDFDTDEFMIALYTDRDILNRDLQEYTPEGEVIGTNYPAGGVRVFVAEGYPKREGDYTAAVRFEDVVFPNLTGNVGAALIYNGENSRAILCIDFGIVQPVVTSDFKIVFPDDVGPQVFIMLPRG